MILSLTVHFALALQAAPASQTPIAREVQAVTAFGQVYPNWNVDCDLPGIRGMRIQFDVELDANGAIVGQLRPVRPQDTPAYRAAAESARRALLDSAPFDVPEEFQGGFYRPTFIPGRVCREADED